MALLLLPAIVLGAVVRTVPVLTSDFPLHDGGFFLVMVDDIVKAGFTLPATTSYNLDGIPFTYPPLALYLVAALSTTGVDPVGLIRWIPFLASLVTIPLVYVVGKELLGSWRLAGVSALAYALLPRSYEWLVIGGGLTRSIGLVFALLTLWQGIRLLTRPSRTHLLLTGLLGGLTMLTHPEASLLVVVSLAVFVAMLRRSWPGLGSVVAAGMIGLIVAAPWWLMASLVHGIDTLFGAAGSRTADFAPAIRHFLFGDFTGATAVDIFLGIGFVGLLVQVGRRRFLLPIWLLAIVVFVHGAGSTYATVPWALLIAVAIMEVIVPAAGRLVPVHRGGRSIVVTGLLGAAVLSSLATGYSDSSPVHGLSAGDRQAMRWAEANLPTDARVAVVTGLPWWNDATSEWFPALAHRHSVATAQGYEWTDEFADRREQHQFLQDLCAHRLANCLEEWQSAYGQTIDYVYVPKGRLAGLASPFDCCPALRADLRRHEEVIFDGEGATIARLAVTPAGS